MDKLGKLLNRHSISFKVESNLAGNFVKSTTSATHYNVADEIANELNAIKRGQEISNEETAALPLQNVSCRTSVSWFAEQMELKLRDNDHKGGWARCEHSWLLNRLKQEVGELEKALDQVDNQENVIKEAADVANFALMIADLAGRLYGS